MEELIDKERQKHIRLKQRECVCELKLRERVGEIKKLSAKETDSNKKR